MRMIGATGMIACVLLLCGVATAQTVTVRQTMDYRHSVYDASSDNSGVWFIPPIPPDHVVDHGPYYRISSQDWGYTHNVAGLVPPDANGIQSATLSIVAWGVSDPYSGEYPEQDIVYADGYNLGLLKSYTESPISVSWPAEGQVGNFGLFWSQTTFQLPAEVLEGLWTSDQLYVWLDIDKLRLGGYRVTLKSSTLTVRYYDADGGGVGTVVPVYRFWSPVLGGHFYTSSEEEMQWLLDEHWDVWDYETVAFRALTDASDGDALPVHRFWSPQYGGHFYTIDEGEMDWLLTDFPDVWFYEDVAYYAYPEGQQPVDAVPVYRFWSSILGRHFYTTSEEEKQWLMDEQAATWTYETIAWYAYAP